MGVEKGLAYLAAYPQIEAIFVTKDRQVVLSAPLQFQQLDERYTVTDSTA